MRPILEMGENFFAKAWKRFRILPHVVIGFNGLKDCETFHTVDLDTILIYGKNSAYQKGDRQPFKNETEHVAI